MEKILFVEDDSALREAASQILEYEGYQVTVVANGRLALEALKHLTPDLIVSDIAMPEMDGFALLDAVRATPTGVTMPFLFISASTDPEKVNRARRHAVDDYIFKPFGLQDLLDAVRSRLDRRRKVLLFDTREAHLQTVTMLANAIEARDPCTRGHVERVREYALALGSALGWSAERLSELEFGAILHDVGKILVPEYVLNKKGPLDAEEMASVRLHVEAGVQMLSGITHLQTVVPYIEYHHEHWAGGGYPHGLAGEAIPLEGRLLALADAYDAMTSERPYREELSKEAALEEICQKKGTQFDPILADVFVKLIRERASSTTSL